MLKEYRRLHEEKYGEFYSPQQVADIIGLHRQSIYKLLRQKDIPSMRIGGKWIIPVSDFDQWFESKKPEIIAMDAPEVN